MNLSPLPPVIKKKKKEKKKKDQVTPYYNEDLRTLYKDKQIKLDELWMTQKHPPPPHQKGLLDS